MNNLDNKTIRLITTFGTIFCMLLATFVTPFAAAQRTSVSTGLTDGQSPQNRVVPNAEPEKKIGRSFGERPLSFEANQGQTDPAVKFLARSTGYTMFFTERETVMKLHVKDGEKASENILRMKFEGANKSPKIEGGARQETKSNYLKGQEANWRRNVTNYEKVAYRELYSGIDAVFYGRQKETEYDFVVAPNAHPEQIKLSFEGAKSIDLDEKGDLHIQLDKQEIIQPKPFIYQEINGERKRIAGNFKINSEKMSVGFELGEYDQNQTLVIDPKLIYSTYFGGNTEVSSTTEGFNGDQIIGVKVDSSGNIFIAGNTASIDFPVAGSALQTQLQAGQFCDEELPIRCGDVFVTKINASGSTVAYSTYIGGANNDQVNDLALDNSGLPVIVGATDPRIIPIFCGIGGSFQTSYPLTNNRFQGYPHCALTNSLNGRLDAFITKLNSNGSGLVYSTLYSGRGEDEATAVAIDSENKIYVAGDTVSPNLPTKNQFQNNLADPNSVSGGDAFIAKFDPNQSGNGSFLYGSYLGGSALDEVLGIDVDAAQNVYIVGGSTSTDLETKSPSNLPPLQSANRGTSDGFIAKVDPTNASGVGSLVYLTYFGGTDQDQVDAIAVEPTTQRAYIVGSSNSDSGVPLLNAFDSVVNAREVFVAKLNADGTALFYSTLLGGDSVDLASDIVIDAAGNAYVMGTTPSANFPTVNGFQTALQGGQDTFIAKISPVPTTATAPKLLWSSFYGGNGDEIGIAMAIDKKGQIYIGGSTDSTNLPVSAVNLKAAEAGLSDTNTDGFVAKIESTFHDSFGVYRPSTSQFLLRNLLSNGGVNSTITFGQAGDLPLVGDWNGDGEDEFGTFDQVSAQFTLRRQVCAIICTIVPLTVSFGQAGDLPLVGDWDGNGIDSIGVYRRSTGQFLLSDSITNPAVTHTVNFTSTSSILPLAGDWNSDGKDTVGIYIPPSGQQPSGQFRLTNQDVLNPIVSISASFGGIFDQPIVGDWDGDGKDTIGVWNVLTQSVHLTNNNLTTSINFNFGQDGDIPLVGDWDGKPNQ
jgi:hypothetical protein